MSESASLPPDLERALHSALTGPLAERNSALDRLAVAYPSWSWMVRSFRLDAGCSSLTPTAIGRYQIVSVLGEGGMGTVFLAEQPELQRRVALKLVKAGMDTHQMLARFESERIKLARMQHECIARVLDAGATPEGRPYFVMELVPGGVPITRYCTEHDLPLAERIALFQRVCEGVQHAHDKMVIHRDLKPDNVLVTRDKSSRPLPKVIDFGLARSVEGEALMTLTGFVVGTPEYMSPEQVAGQDLDKRTDVYSLGIILYELLTGVRPFSSDELRRASPVELQKILTQKDPLRPSMRVGTKAQVRALAGDLDWITMKAMEKDRARRYASPNELAQDLDRHLRDEPVTAGPPSTAYRIRKFVRRYRGLVTAGIGMLLLLLAGVVTSTLFWVRAETNLDRFHLVRDVVRLEEAKAIAATLWPAFPDRAPAMRHWLAEQAEPLAARLPVLRAARDDMRKRAHRAEGADPADTFLHAQVSKLVTDLEAFMAENGTVATVRIRLEEAETVHERTIENQREEWDRAIAAIATHPKYGGLKVTPQIGLVPIGPDPDSTLWEFGHPASGQVPQRGDDGRFPVTDGMSIVLVLLPGGPFTLGAQRSAEHETGYEVADSEGPPHQVILDPFLLSRYELTKAQWKRLSNADDPSGYKVGGEDAGNPQTISDRHPVESISWQTCHQQLRYYGLSLPTEAQWEYGCRAGTMTAWWTGKEAKSLAGAANVFDEHARRHGRGWGFPETFDDRWSSHAPVGSYRPNPFGLFDMHGNVYEWCADWYLPYSCETRRGDGLREAGVTSVTNRVYRGGCFVLAGHFARTTARGYQSPAYESDTVGCRPARLIQP
jgi:formylglycine-generating enzyme required for sulfatase activity